MIDLKTFAAEPFRLHSRCLDAHKNRLCGIKLIPSASPPARVFAPTELLKARPDLDTAFSLLEGWHWYEHDGSLYYLCRPNNDQCRMLVDVLAHRLSITGWDNKHQVTEAERMTLATLMCPMVDGWRERKRSVNHLMSELGEKLGGRLRRVAKRRARS